MEALQTEVTMEVLFVASVSPIVRNSDVTSAFYKEALGLSFEGGEGDYVFTEQLGGVKHLGLWPLADAASACFGTTEWPADVEIAPASIEFEVTDVAAAAGRTRTTGLPADPRRENRTLDANHRPAAKPRGATRPGVPHTLVP
jgi:hypothetical protein